MSGIQRIPLLDLNFYMIGPEYATLPNEAPKLIESISAIYDRISVSPLARFTIVHPTAQQNAHVPFRGDVEPGYDLQYTHNDDGSLTIESVALMG